MISMRDDQMKKLLSGDVNCKFNCLALSMCVTRLKHLFEANPADTLTEFKIFLMKNEKILEKDIPILTKI